MDVEGLEYTSIEGVITLTVLELGVELDNEDKAPDGVEDIMSWPSLLGYSGGDAAEEELIKALDGNSVDGLEEGGSTDDATLEIVELRVDIVVAFVTIGG